ncbi:uncharacterized protein L969DRAFT_95624 [Mixia osmundae IAM 14324]|uniref:Uncharacterized protein n=1 Tax=Mixia osmundae (strain CBS 9802 / IAM 14324 / JCM 22182 / KY 12970) TaxID=764103 RepID=G7E7Z0_MIXOS|nr:uncharacterized protein L969DRAFT_95624 [Mixia osmundae IAM 14324]KEI38549.1 hypothetical protein L969DRAFT_95624 [Mixia osmundae IAM 14324]GAA98950.1 hypothetical protein E5Q_05638 [Mixia osmundae IAM 14324]
MPSGSVAISDVAVLEYWGDSSPRSLAQRLCSVATTAPAPQPEVMMFPARLVCIMVGLCLSASIATAAVVKPKFGLLARNTQTCDPKIFFTRHCVMAMTLLNDAVFYLGFTMKSDSRGIPMYIDVDTEEIGIIDPSYNFHPTCGNFYSYQISKNNVDVNMRIHWQCPERLVYALAPSSIAGVGVKSHGMTCDSQRDPSQKDAIWQDDIKSLAWPGYFHDQPSCLAK